MSDEGRRDAAAEDLARRASERDPAAWSELFEEHYSAVYAFARYRLHGAGEAEDLASQAFEVAYSNAHRFDYRGVPIQAWLIGIARNLCRDHVKKLRRRGHHEEITEMVMPLEPSRTESVDLRRDLATAMAALTDDQQTVLSLRFVLDKSVAETAQLMDRSEDAVKNLQRRALAAMNRELQGMGFEGGSA